MSDRAVSRGFTFATRSQELLLIVAAILVAVAMVAAAELARDTAERHLRAQVLVERVQASAEELDAISAQALADTWAGHTAHPSLDPTVVARGFGAWNRLAGALRELRSIERGPETTALTRDATSLFGVGMQTLTMARGGQLQSATKAEEQRFRPAISRLNTDSERAAQREQAVASRAAGDEQVAFFGSLGVGLAALILLGWRLQRLRRTAERRTSEARSERRVRALLEHATDVVTVLGDDLRVRWQGASMEQTFGHEPDALIGTELGELIHPEDRSRIDAFLAQTARVAGSHAAQARFRHKTTGWRDVEIVADNRLDDPAVEGIVVSMRDVSDRKVLEDELRHRASHDPLTGLANRTLFEERLDRAFAVSTRLARPFALLFLDLDDFKQINDTLGHARGDALLRAAAVRITHSLRPTDTAARLGGDEFAIIVEPLDGAEEAQAVARRVLDALLEPFAIGERELQISASVGVAVWPQAGDTEHLLRHADIAMYAAKEQGKASVCVFEPSTMLTT